MVENSIGYFFGLCCENWPNSPDELEKEWCRYEDYYDGRPERLRNETYFPRLKREHASRYDDRPKLTIPLCRAIADLHAGALVRDQLHTTIDDVGAQKVWDEIEQHNNMNAHARKITTVMSVYGCAVNVPRKWDDGSPDKQIEWEVYTPNRARPIYDSGSAGASVVHLRGVQIRTLYNTVTGQIVQYSRQGILERVRNSLGIGQWLERIEFISDTHWVVWLDGKVSPTSPDGKARWMPRDDGTNPFGKGAVLFNNLETHEGVLGQSNIRSANHDNETLNHLWSDTVYAARIYAPILVLQSDDEVVQTQFRGGIGSGMSLGRNDSLEFATPPSGLIKEMLEPVRIQLELLYSNSKSPAIAMGMGHMFEQTDVSGRAKEIEYRPTVKHAEACFPAFSRAWTETVRFGLTIAGGERPFGQAKSVKVDADVTVLPDGEIVPTTAIERIETERAAVFAGFRSLFEAMKNIHRYTDDQASTELDRIAAETRRKMTGTPYERLNKALFEMRKIKITPEQTTEDVEALFGPPMMVAADAADEDTPEEKAAKEGQP